LQLFQPKLEECSFHTRLELPLPTFEDVSLQLSQGMLEYMSLHLLQPTLEVCSAVAPVDARGVLCRQRSRTWTCSCGRRRSNGCLQPTLEGVSSQLFQSRLDDVRLHLLQPMREVCLLQTVLENVYSQLLLSTLENGCYRRRPRA
jgi:hypothetical protein